MAALVRDPKPLRSGREPPIRRKQLQGSWRVRTLWAESRWCVIQSRPDPGASPEIDPRSFRDLGADRNLLRRFRSRLRHKEKTGATGLEPATSGFGDQRSTN